LPFLIKRCQLKGACPPEPLRYFRPTEVETLLGDPTKAKQKLGWVPEITVQEMCAEMVAGDLEEAQRHALLKKHGFNVAVCTEH